MVYASHVLALAIWASVFCRVAFGFRTFTSASDWQEILIFDRRSGNQRIRREGIKREGISRERTVLAWCLHGAFTIQVCCILKNLGRNSALRFFHMRVLVLCPVHNLDCTASIGDVATNEAKALQSAQHEFDVYVVRWEQRHLQAARTVFKAPFTIRFGPHANEEQACGKVQLCQVFVREEPRLDVS